MTEVFVQESEFDPPRHWVSKNYEAFNALRGIAVLLVFSRHYVTTLTSDRIWQFGWIGVDFFFVLSGFLITGILYDARSSPTFFRDFYIRRALRVFPLYFGFFLLVGIFWKVEFRGTSAAVLAYACYVGNLFSEALNQHGHNAEIIKLVHPTGRYLDIGHFWSLCIEEQFYLVWPFVVRFAKDRRQIMGWCVGSCLLAFFSRALLLYYGDHGLIYLATFAHCDGLFAGSFLALLIRERNFRRSELKRIAGWTFGTGAAILLVGLPLTYHLGGAYDNPFMALFGYDLLSACFVGVLLWAINPQTRIAKALKGTPWLGRLGVVSYGVYFFHNMPSSLFRSWLMPRLARHGVPTTLGIFGLFLGIYVVAELSFRYYESFFLRFKDQLAPGHKSLPTPAQRA